MFIYTKVLNFVLNLPCISWDVVVVIHDRIYNKDTKRHTQQKILERL
jgi:hypothetical protein